MSDNVNHPQHYTGGDIECIDAIKSSMSPEEYQGYLKGNVIKYLWRYRIKTVEPIEDIRKAQWYLNKLEEYMRTNNIGVYVDRAGFWRPITNTINLEEGGLK